MSRHSVLNSINIKRRFFSTYRQHRIIPINSMNEQLKDTIQHIKLQSGAVAGGAILYPTLQCLTGLPSGFFSIFCCSTHLVAAYQGYRLIPNLLKDEEMTTFSHYALNRHFDLILSTSKEKWWYLPLKKSTIMPKVEVGVVDVLSLQINRLYKLKQSRFRNYLGMGISSGYFGGLSSDLYYACNAHHAYDNLHAIIAQLSEPHFSILSCAIGLFISMGVNQSRQEKIKEVIKNIDLQLNTKNWIFLPNKQLVKF